MAQPIHRFTMVVGVTFPIDLNEPVKQLVKYVHRKVSHRFEPDANRRRKLIAMAQECASTLQIDDWHLVPWDPLYVTMDMLQILAASEECNTLEGATQIAWLLGGDDIVLRKSYVQFGDNSDKFEYVGYVEKIDFNHLIDYYMILTEAIGEWSGESVLRVFDDRFHFDINPLRKHVDLSEALTPEIQMEWKNILDFIRNLNKENGKILTSQNVFCEDKGFQIDYLQNRMHSTFYAALMFRFGMSACLEGDRILGMGIDDLRASCCFREYIAFLLQVLQSKSDVGTMTNSAKLKCIHVSNCTTPNHGKKAWEMFAASLEDRKRRLSVQTMSIRRPSVIPDMDLIDVLRRTLGGRLRKVDGIQVSIADNLLGVKEVGKDTFSGRISRRKVQLLQCGKDNVLVLPYLNTIVFQLKDDRWIRDYDAQALQPCRGVQKYEGSVRRAATVLLAFDYPKTGEPVVNQDAFNIIYRHARKGELFSKNLRKKLLSVKEIHHRVDIRALEMRASEVFKDDEVMMAALTREMAHDVLMTKSCCEIETASTKDRSSKASRSFTQLTCADDAYYDTLYRRGGIRARNNIIFISGVPLLGLRTDNVSIRTGQLGGQEMHGVAIVKRYYGEKVVVWIPERKCQENDCEVPAAFIENRECVDGKVIELLSKRVSSKGRTLDNFRLGGYCRLNIDIGAPPEKQRKKGGPSSNVAVDDVQKLFVEMEVTNVS